MFEITRNKGMHITFENGVTVSIQMGGGSYSDNYHWKIGGHTCIVAPPSKTAEVMIWRRDKDSKDDPNVALDLEPFMLNDSCVKGWCTPEDILEILNEAARYEPDEHK